MRKLLMAAAATALLVGGSAALARTVGVTITKDGFNPRTVTIQSGDSVSWKNADTAEHQLAVDKTPCKLNLAPGQTGSCTFGTPGTFTYTDPGAKASGFTGTLTVAKNTRAVTLASSRMFGIFGGAMTLSGTVSSKQAGETVTIVAQPAGEPAWSTRVITTSGGNWSLQVQPRIRTTYQARFENATSPSLTLNVRPRITLQKVGRDRFLVVVLAAHSMSGKTVDLARWTGGRYLTFAQAQLQPIARTSTIATTVFTAPFRLGTKLRVFMPSTQTAPDYIDGHSNFVIK
jgi:plastocyanin